MGRGDGGVGRCCASLAWCEVCANTLPSLPGFWWTFREWRRIFIPSPLLGFFWGGGAVTLLLQRRRPLGVTRFKTGQLPAKQKKMTVACKKPQVSSRPAFSHINTKSFEAWSRLRWGFGGWGRGQTLGVKMDPEVRLVERSDRSQAANISSS